MKRLIAALLGAAAIASPAIAQQVPEANEPAPDARGWDGRGDRAAQREAWREVRQERRADRAEAQVEQGRMREELRDDRDAARQEFRQERRENRLERLRDRAEVQQQSDSRGTWRSDRGDWNDGRGQDWNDRRQGEWNERARGDWDDRRRGDWNDGRRGDWNDRRRGDWSSGRQWGDWNQGWRRDPRYNWQDWRFRNRGQFRLPPYSAPRNWGFGYRRYNPGIIIAPSLFARNYWILDPWEYRLPPAYGPYRWVRYYDDVLLVDLRTGRVVDVIPDFFW